MTETSIEQLRIPDTLEGEPAADFLRVVEVSRQVRVHTWGNDTLAYTAEELFAQCHDPYEWYVVLVARKGGEIVGRAGIAMPLDDNTDHAHVTLDVLPEASGQGLGRELLEAAETFVRGENRKIVMVETNHPAAAFEGAESEQIPALRGGGTLPLSSREARFAYSAGYELERVEQFSACQLPLEASLIDALTERAGAAHTSSYTVHQWIDACPEQWAQDFVRLERVLVMGMADASGDDPWDVAQLREAEDLSVKTGRRTLVSAAECTETGALVGFTSISVLGSRDDVAFQDETVVESAYSGQDLGLRIKVANMVLLMREFPQTGTIFTWNAPENAYLLSVNTQLGYTGAGMTGQWRKDFTAM